MRKSRAKIRRTARPRTGGAQASSSFGIGFGGNYDAATWSLDRSYRPWIPVDSTDSLNPLSRSTMAAYAEGMYNNIGLVKGIVDGIARRVGAPIPQSLAEDETWAAEAEAAFLETVKILDRSRKLDYPGLCATTIKRDFVSGDFGVVLLDDSYPQIALVESHRIRAESNNTNDNIVDGVEVDSQGRPQFYHVRIADEETTRIEARNFKLIFKPMGRADQVRGVTEMHAAIRRLHDLFYDIWPNEMLAVKEAGAVGLIVKGGTPRAMFGKLRRDGTRGQTFEDMRGGAMPRLLSGESLESFQTNRPSPTFAGFSDLIIRDICCGCGWPIEFVYGTAGQGTAERKVLQQAQWVVDEWSGILENQLLTPLWGWVISKLIKRGQLGKNKEWWKVAYQRPAKMTLDVGRESQQRRQNMLLGVESEDDWASDTGRNFEMTRRQILRERKYLVKQVKELMEFSETETGVALTYQQALELLRQPGPNAVAQFSAPEPDNSDEPNQPPQKKETPDG